VTSKYLWPFKEDLVRFDFEVDKEDEHLCDWLATSALANGINGGAVNGALANGSVNGIVNGINGATNGATNGNTSHV
jgi:hypothetical protein